MIKQRLTVIRILVSRDGGADTKELNSYYTKWTKVQAIAYIFSVHTKTDCFKGGLTMLATE